MRAFRILLISISVLMAEGNGRNFRRASVFQSFRRSGCCRNRFHADRHGAHRICIRLISDGIRETVSRIGTRTDRHGKETARLRAVADSNAVLTVSLHISLRRTVIIGLRSDADRRIHTDGNGRARIRFRTIPKRCRTVPHRHGRRAKRHRRLPACFRRIPERRRIHPGRCHATADSRRIGAARFGEPPDGNGLIRRRRRQPAYRHGLTHSRLRPIPNRHRIITGRLRLYFHTGTRIIVTTTDGNRITTARGRCLTHRCRFISRF